MPNITFNRTTTLSFPGSQIADITSGIVNGSLAVREILCADRITFGDINANQFQCQLYDCPNLLGKKIQVKQTDNGTVKTVFTGWVTSCKTDDLTGFKSIEAYDYFYKARKKRIKKWWKNYWSNRAQSTIGAMWKSMLDYYSVSYVNTSLLFDDIIIKKKYAKKLKTSYMTTFLNQLCEINLCVPNMNRNGSLEFIQFENLDADYAIDVRDYYTISGSKFEEEVAVPYDKVELYTEKNESVESAGEGDNVLSIQNNVFLYGLGSDVLQDMANYILTHMYRIEYITGNITMKVSNLDIHLGDVLRVADKGGNERYCLVCENNYKGSLLVDQSIISNYEDDPNIEHGVYGNTIPRNTDRLEYNLDLKPDNYSGTDIPLDSSGKVGDTYFKTGRSSNGKVPMYPIEYYGPADDIYWDKSLTPNIASVKNFEYNKQTGTYKFDVTGSLYSSGTPNGYTGDPVFKVGIDTSDPSATYKIICDAIWETNGGYAVAMPGFSGFTNSNSTNPGSPPGTGGDPRRFTGGNTLTHYELDSGNAGPVDFTQPIYMWLNYWFPFSPTTGGYLTIHVTNLRIEKVINPQTGETDGGYTETFTDYIDGIYTKPANTETDAGESSWQEVDYVHKVDDSENSGLSYGRSEPDAQKTLSLKPNVMRAWFKADPPQVKRTFNQFCMRYTGKPDNAINISLHSNTGWLNKSIKKDSEGVFTVKSAGTVSSGNIEYCAYEITGLTSGQRYYFNLKCNFKDGTTFNKDYTKGLGLVFNTTGVIDTDDWTGDPNTFDNEHLYYSMPRRTTAFFADFDFVATATTMYMCVVVADITSGQSSSLTLSRFVISKTERDYIRTFYAFDLESNDWLQYKPWGSGDEGGDGGASTLGDLDDVNLDNIQNGQTLYYNAATGEWTNADPYELPIASANTLGGIKVGANLSIDANGVLSATGGASDVELVELTQAEYNLLTPEQKADPNVIYFITDAGGGGGGGGTGSGKVDTLYKASSTTAPNTITLSKALTNYDFIITHIKSANSGQATIGYIYTVDAMNVGDIVGGELAAGNGWIWYTYTNATTLTYLGVNNTYYIEEISGIKFGSGSGGGGSSQINSEIVTQKNIRIDDGTEITLNLTKKYTNPYVYATNTLPKTGWGGLVVVNMDYGITYDSTNDTLSFKTYTNYAQNYDIYWLITEMSN